MIHTTNAHPKKTATLGVMVVSSTASGMSR